MQPSSARIALFALWDEGDERDDEELAEVFDILITTVVHYRSRYLTDTSLFHDIIHIPEEELPLITRKGVVWCSPVEVEAMYCDECPYLVECKEAVGKGWYAACEVVFGDELLPESVRERME